MKRFNDLWNPKYFNLSNFAESIISQNNEDGVIDAIFKICGTNSKYCVDVGANDGIWCSNTRYLINHGWAGLMIEINPDIYGKLQNNCKYYGSITTVNREAREDNIEQILDEFSCPGNMDFISIDIDGKDYEIWRGLEKYHPNLVVIEFNEEKIDFNDLYYNPMDTKGGAGLGILNKLAEERGYDYLCIEHCNAFFIDREFGRKLLR